MFIVDLPTIGQNGTWTEAGIFDTKKEAIEWIRKNIGHCDDEGNISLLTELDEPKEDRAIQGYEEDEDE